MKRRDLLKRSATTIAGLGVIPPLSILFESCSIERVSDYTPVYLNNEQFDTIWQLAELILPRTDTPGASDAGVAPFIDLLFSSYFTEADRSGLEDQLNGFISNCQATIGDPFLGLSEAAMLRFLNDLEGAGDPFFDTMKRMTLWAFFTSEVGMKSMNYQPNPGQYDGCTTIDENEKLMVGNQGPRGYFNQ